MKRSKQLEPLSHDHFEGLTAASRLQIGVRKGAFPKVMAAYVDHFWHAALERHFHLEETLLLPLLTTPALSSLAERLIEEHREIKDLVEQLNEAREPIGLLEELSRVLKAHIRFEERELFPALEAEASRDSLQEVGRMLNDAHVDVHLDWTPAFWE